ncbi:MAG: YbgC/FadM family acyl-CoA thioesterase [Candidatus Eisenbacteria bacterium]|nr:YbgC/FadM family acyl-CoA thioesterase [Candidatus Eisenbacteria bacterium]
MDGAGPSWIVCATETHMQLCFEGTERQANSQAQRKFVWCARCNRFRERGIDAVAFPGAIAPEAGDTEGLFRDSCRCQMDPVGGVSKSATRRRLLCGVRHARHANSVPTTHLTRLARPPMLSASSDATGAGWRLNMSPTWDHPIRVRYAEVDQMGWVYHSHYLTWFEVGRTELIRNLGKPYRDIEAGGFLLPLTEATLRLRRPARYDDALVIRTTVASVATRRVVFRYEILNDGDCGASGTSTHICTGARSGKATVLPEWLRNLLRGNQQ